MKSKATGYKSTNYRLELAGCISRLSFARPKGGESEGKDAKEKMDNLVDHF